MKIFIGCYDIALILSGVAEGLKLGGHEVTTFVLEKNKFYSDVKYDFIKEPFISKKINYQNKRLPSIFKKCLQKTDAIIHKKHLESLTESLIEEHDLFIFIWEPWLPEEILFPKIKKAGKKIICVQVGSDVRHIDSYKQEFNEDVSLWEQYFHEESLNEKIKKVRFQELYADSIFSVPDQAGLLIRSYHHIYIPLNNIKNIPFNIPDREVPLIIHAPSRTGIKGTTLITNTIDKLKEEGFAFEFKLIQNMTNENLLKELTNADILIDQIFLHGPGVLGTEAMAAGTLVLTRFFEKHEKVFNPPVVDIRPDNIYEKLKHVLMNRGMYKEFQVKGREFVESNNTPQKVADKIINSLSSEKSEYQPDFFVDKFVLNAEQKLTKEAVKLNQEIVRKYRPSYENNPSLIQRNLI